MTRYVRVKANRIVGGHQWHPHYRDVPAGHVVHPVMWPVASGPPFGARVVPVDDPDEPWAAVWTANNIEHRVPLGPAVQPWTPFI